MSEVPFGPSGKVVHERTYARPKGDGLESWQETVSRVTQGNIALVYGEPEVWSNEIQYEAYRLERYMRDFAILPAGRHLWASGVTTQLFNCVAQGTLVHTRDGIVPIEKLTGATVDVLSEGNIYRPATFYSYGEQAIYKVTLARGEEFYATAAHEWVTVQPDANRRVTTDKLAGKRIPYNAAPRPAENDEYTEGFAHGVVYGDGSRASEVATMVHLFGTKRELTERLLPFSRLGAVEHEDRTYIGTLPADWKGLPGREASRSYWRGFVNGLIATDGTVKKGSVCLDQSDLEAMHEIRKGAMWAGFVPTGIKMTRERSPYTGEYAPSYRFTIRGWSISKEDLVRSNQVAAFGESQPAKVRTARVLSVEPTGRVEEVYCCVEPETHTMTIGSGILTGQCHHAGWGNKFSEHFKFTSDRLFEGGGVGANYSTRFMKQYGAPLHRVELSLTADHAHPDFGEMEPFVNGAPEIFLERHMVEDSREGWSAALEDLIDAFFDPKSMSRYRWYDASNIRASGSPLVTSGGTASGPGPLLAMLQKTADVLNRAYMNGVITPLDAMEIDHAIAEAVVAGGTRRSARMAMVDWDDPWVMDFINCKADTGKHWTTNISVAIDDEFIKGLTGDVKRPPHPWAVKVHKAVCEAVLTNGEPGYWNASLNAEGEPNPEALSCNPCGEITLEPWEACNLGHVNMDYFYDSDWEELEEAHRLVTRFLIRATFGSSKSAKQREVMDRNRRIGVGHLGVQGYWAKRGIKYSSIPEYAPLELECLYREVRAEASSYAAELGIPEPVKVTTVAPTGSVAKLPGVSEGIHPIYARWFEQRIRFSMRDPKQANTVLEAMEQGYKTETDSYDASGQTAIVVYPTENILVQQVRELGIDESVVQSAEELTAREMFEVQACYQEHWADNAVSYTVNIPENSMTPADLEVLLAEYLPRVKGTTIMVDATRKQPPFTRITKVQYEEAKARSEGDGVSEECSGGACPVKLQIGVR